MTFALVKDIIGCWVKHLVIKLLKYLKKWSFSFEIFDFNIPVYDGDYICSPDFGKTESKPFPIPRFNLGYIHVYRTAREQFWYTSTSVFEYMLWNKVTVLKYSSWFNHRVLFQNYHVNHTLRNKVKTIIVYAL